MKIANTLGLLLLCLGSLKSMAQDCPPNIGFETGTFDHWDCYTGMVNSDGSLTLNPSTPTPNRHTLLKNNFTTSIDPYGGFPVNCPNGSGYSIQLGNNATGREAEGVSYTFTIPANQNGYSIIYNYAVVFQNPSHMDYQQPRFASRVYNVTDGLYVDCGSFEFKASSNLPGFQKAPVGDQVFFKPWAPVTLNLSGLSGKTVRLEFTTNDCTLGGHFGYAYLDVNENCTSPISGSTYCIGSGQLILTAPYGFETYNWFNADFSQKLGTGNVLVIAPPPPVNTVYAVEVFPFFGLGCHDTLYTNIHVSSDPFNLKVIDSLTGCSSGVDLTAPYVTAGSTPGLNYTYYSDPNQINYVPLPNKVTTSGTYYIKGVNSAGCNDIKPIAVVVKPAPDIVITDPIPGCVPQKVDITTPAVVAGSQPGLTYSYWKDPYATIALPNPKTIDSSGLYYIKGVDNTGCSNIQAVKVQIGTIPTLTVHDPVGCGSVNLTLPGVTGGSLDVTLSYWSDAAASAALAMPDSIMTSCVYFIKATTSLGCSVTKPVSIVVNPNPSFTVTDPAPVKYPVTTVDITKAVTPVNGLSFSYWEDIFAVKPVLHPTVIDKRGTYYIKARNSYGCITIKPVNVAIIPSPDVVIFAPNAFSPNNDGLNDIFLIKILGEVTINHFKIFNRWGQTIIDYPDVNHAWDGKYKGIDQPPGTFTWLLDGYDEYYKKKFTRFGTIVLLR